MLARTLSADPAEQETGHHRVHPKKRLRRESSTSASSFCNVLHYLGIYHIFKLIRILFQKIFKWVRAVFSHMWVNMSSYFFLNPPVILFSINIIIFTVILTFISLYARVVEVAESGEDWRFFLQSFSKLELCIVPFNPNTTSLSSLPPPDKHKTGQNVKFGTHSIPISLSIKPTREFVQVSHTVSHLSTSMYGKYIGLQGDNSQTLLSVTLSFRHTWNSSSCDNSKLLPCQFVDIDGCISFHGPKNIFPENKHLRHCPSERKNHDDTYYFAGLNWQIPDVNPLYYCRSRSTIKANFDNFLSKLSSEKVIEPSARLHLLSTSFFLMMLVVVVLLYAALVDHWPHPFSRRFSVPSESLSG